MLPVRFRPPRRARWVSVISAALLVCIGAGCEPADELTEPSVQLEGCRLQGVSEELRCADVQVFEDRAAGQGRSIPIHVVVAPAFAPRPAADPLFFLAGGPGQAAAELLPQILPLLDRVRRQRDLVFVDQRGTGGSNGLECPIADDLSLAERLEDGFDPQKITECLQAQEGDLTLYGSAAAMDDLDDVRAALGYGQINLYGVSYGTRAALVYMRRHPQHVRSVVLDGVAPLTMKLFVPFGEDGERALNKAFDDCAADQDCSAAFPQLRSEFEQLLNSFGDGREVAVHDPLSGEQEVVTLNRDVLAGGVRGLLYNASLASLLPLSIHEAAAGNLDPLIGQMLTMASGTSTGFYEGMMLSVVCSEDVPFITDADVEAQVGSHFLGDRLVRLMRDTCDLWPKTAIDPAFKQAVESDAPTLVLSGDLDPVTPPRWGDEATKTLSNSRHIVVPGTGHNAAFSGCLPRLFAEFIDTADAHSPDAECVEAIKRPPFFLDFAGGAP